MFKVVRIFVGISLVYISNVYALMPMGLGTFRGKFMGGMGMGGGMGLGGGAGMGYGGLKLLGSSDASGGSFGEGKKMYDDMFSKKGFGSEGMQFGLGNSGFSMGEGLMKDMKGESGFYNGAQGGKNSFADGKGYYGGQFIGNNGQNVNEVDAKKGHKKGRTVKGFHTSHESNEANNSEEVYDEEHDEADKKALKMEEGKFGENKGEAFKGEKADSKFQSEGGKKEGMFETSMGAGKESAESEKYGGNKFGAQGGTFGVKNGGDIHGNSGHHEANKMFKHFKV